ncbi:MAG TPA: hypothetical protein DHW82_13625 [Spirochaetia bacterium]|nr:MAG: hypothetical protein A2Y41_08845 [Spirochaetes bacterium GWB1_36_13]HCL58029.1 hypothetical protein [Spirochaetia bacterium]
MKRLFFIFLFLFHSWGYGIEIKISILGIFKPKAIRVLNQENHQVYEIRIGGQNQILVNGKNQIFFTLESSLPLELSVPSKIKRSYVGKILISNQSGILQIVNQIEIEDYIKSVVNSEIGAAPLEALKTQAVLARSKAYEAIMKSGKKAYHLTDLTDSQVYKGFEAVTKKSSRAAAETEGEVLWFEGKIPEIFYASTCAGGTVLPKDVWGKNSPGYEAVPCGYCTQSPHYQNWKWEVSLQELEKIFNVSHLKHIEVQSSDSFGRVLILSLVFEDGVRRVLKAEDFRIIIGRYYRKWGLVKSSFFSIVELQDKLVFVGKGLGHGVGLCQYGAKEMAFLGWDYQKILNYYYPKMTIGQWEVK